MSEQITGRSGYMPSRCTTWKEIEKRESGGGAKPETICPICVKQVFS
jgi:hypothetical protein